jgi:hypothetical protein
MIRSQFTRHKLAFLLNIVIALAATPIMASGQKSADEAAGELFLGESAYSRDRGEFHSSLGHSGRSRSGFGESLPMLLAFGITHKARVEPR